MLIKRNIQMLGTIVLILAATIVTVSAVRPAAPADLSWSSRPNFSFLAKSDAVHSASNEAGLAQYHLSERGAPASTRDGLAVYQQSERVLAYATKSNAEGLAIYHQSEWFGK